jgi:hypothetical protein
MCSWFIDRRVHKKGKEADPEQPVDVYRVLVPSIRISKDMYQMKPRRIGSYGSSSPYQIHGRRRRQSLDEYRRFLEWKPRSTITGSVLKEPIETVYLLPSATANPGASDRAKPLATGPHNFFVK